MPEIELIHKQLKIFVKNLQKEINPLEIANIFNNSLFDSENQIATSDSTKIAAYILVHQLIFYHIITISAADISAIPLLDEILKEKNFLERIRTEFIKIKSKNEIFQKIFEYDVISAIENTNSETIKHLCQYIVSLSTDLGKGDILGKVFHKMIPLNLRKHVGSYYTLDFAAKILANLVITKDTQVVVDPACGSGTLLIEAYEAKKKCKNAKENFLISDHVRFLEEEIFGFDIMPFSLYLATINLIMKNISALPKKINLFLSDSNLVFQNISINKELNNIIASKDFDIVIMNPPFTKKQLMTHANNLDSINVEYRKMLKNNYGCEYANGILNNKSPLYAYFLIIADRILENKTNVSEPNEKYIAAVLPLVFLQSQNEKHLRNYLKTKYFWKYIILNETSGNFSEDTQLSEIMLVLKKRPPCDSSNQEILQYIFLKKIDENKLDEVVHSIRNPSIKETEFLIKIFINSQNLDFDNLFYPISLGSMNIEYLKDWSIMRKSDVFVSLGAIPNLSIESKNSPEPRSCKLSFKEMMFVEKKFKKNAMDPEILEIGTKNLKIRNKNGKIIELNKENLKLALKYPSKVSQLDISNLNQFVLYNIDEGLDFKEKNANWEIWKKYLDNRSTNFALIDRVNYIRPGVSLFAFFSMQPRVISRNLAAIKGLGEFNAKFITLYINSSFGILEWISTSVPQQLSFCQHHKNTLMKIKVINPNILNNDEINETNAIFSQLAKIYFPSLTDQFIALVSQDFKEKYKDYLYKIRKFEIASSGFDPRLQLDIFILKIISNHCKDQISNALINKYDGFDEILRQIHERIAWLLITNSIQNGKHLGENDYEKESGEMAKI